MVLSYKPFKLLDIRTGIITLKSAKKIKTFTSFWSQMEKVCRTFESSGHNPFTAVAFTLAWNVCMFVISVNVFTQKACTSNKLSSYAGSQAKLQLHILLYMCKIILKHLVIAVHRLDHTVIGSRRYT